MRNSIPRMDRNGWLILASKGLRSFGFGLNAIALGLYLSALGLPGTEIGLILSAALAGTMLLTLLITFWGDRIGRRRLLLLGSALMLLAALIPTVGANSIVLAFIGLSGMVGVTSHESSGLHSIDQAVLPQTAPAEQRTAVFALYNMVTASTSALGALAAAVIPAVGTALGLSGASAFAPAFWLYGLLGLLAVGLTARLDRRAETGQSIQRRLAIHRSRGVVARLSALYALDSLAGSFVVQSFLAYWFATRFGAQPEFIGPLFFVGGLLATASFPAAAWMAARIGLVRTMVFTHIPASSFLIGMALVPWLPVAAALYLGRATLSSMDVPARQSYTMAVVDPDERTAAAGITSLARSTAQVAGPGLAGVVFVPLALGLPLVATGVLKIVYDLALFALFRSRPAPEEVRPVAADVPDDIVPEGG